MKRFWDKVKIAGPDECWEWLSSKKPFGHGDFYFNKKTVLAHRMVWLLINGEIPDGMCVCHKCDNPSCVNINHLFLATKIDNNRDMFNKKRNYHVKITHCPKGHEYSAENTRIYKSGSRACKTCNRIKSLEYIRKKHA